MYVRHSIAAILLLAVGIVHGAPAPMGYADARHLLGRTGFGPTDAEVRTFAAMTREQAVATLLRDARSEAITPPPVWALETGPTGAPRGDNVSAETRKAFQQLQIRHGVELRGWWVQEMLITPSPLTERMTLFWHNHFVSSQQKVRVARFMYAQNALLRANALGNFGTMLHAVSKDPAMLIYLDTAQSRKGQPNENFAREVMELFTLGEGHYGEQDIKEAARAFTGWSVDRETGRYLFRPGTHDYGVKTVLGKSGNFDGDDVLDVLLARPQAAQFVTAKLWREFVSPDPDAREVARIAQIFRSQNLEVKVALRALLLSKAFWAPEHRGTLVKSPVELVVGTLRQLELSPAAAAPFASSVAGMGQNLMSPPNVKGWPGGEVWINSSTLLARKQFLNRLVRAAEPPASMSSSLVMTTAPNGGDANTARTPEGSMIDARPINVAAATPVGAATPSITSVAAVSPGAIALAPAVTTATAADDDKARARRAALAVERSMRDLQFDATQWVAHRAGPTPSAKMDAAQALLLPLPALTAETLATDVDATAFMRSTLLDPAYQLK